MAPDVTVIVCTRDRPSQLEACLGALASQRYPSFDVLVIDNGSAEPVDDICRKWSADSLREPVAGLTRARNLGARAARGQLVAYIDDDAIAEPGWLAALADEFEDAGVAAVVGRTRYMKAHGNTLRMSDEEAIDETMKRPRRSFDRSAPDWFTLACFGGIGDGNTMAFRRSLLIDAVRFDERLGRGRLIEGGDEHVAFMSLISDGHRVVHAPNAVVRHPTPATPALRRAKRIRDLRASVSYLMFLWFQFPGHRADISRFLRKALLKRVSGTAAASASTTGLTGYQSLVAALGGVHIYWRARQEWRAHARSQGRTTETPTPRIVTMR